jgi:outer membrane autotransporter protein
LDIINEGGDLLVDGGVDPLDKFGPDDGFDPLDDYGPDDGYDPLDDYGQDDGLDPLDDYGQNDDYDSSDDYGAGERAPNAGEEKEHLDDGLSLDKPYPERGQEAKARGQSRRDREANRRRLQAAARAQRPNPCPRPFFKAKGGQSKRDDGHELTLKSFSLLAGVDCGRRLNSGLLTFGLAFEGGKGSYDSRRSLPTGLVQGSGDLDYSGGALIGRFDFRPRSLGRLYVESSLRAGQLKSDFQTRDFSGAYGRNVSYKTDNPYIGFQFGVGDYLPLNQVSYLNVYAQYFWTKLKGGEVKLNTGEVVNIENIYSQRLRAGAQYHRVVGERWRVFGGAAFERETDGETKARYLNYKLPSSSKKGGVGLFELGLAYSSKTETPVNFSIALQGNVGHRRGGAGIVQLGVVF